MKVKKENFAAKLNRLFKEKRKPDGTLYTQTEVVENTKGVLTRVYLWKLRTGRASNPGLQVIRALAEFFGVDPSYFFVNDKMSMEFAKEYIFYRDNVPLMHQVHIQLHELSHFLLGHPTLQINRTKITEVLEKKASFPFDELPRLRSSDKTILEIQAETLAALIQKQVIQYSSLDQLNNDLSSEVKLANFLKTMGLS